VFNFEGGCYAKMINLSAEGEPEIYATTKMFGTILENVAMDETTRELDFNDASLDRKHPRCLPDRVHSQHERKEPRPAAVEHHHPDRRRLRRAAPDRAADARSGDVPLPLGLYRQGRWHRNRRDRAAGDLQHLLRRRLHAAPSQRLWQSPQGSGLPRAGAVLAGQHRLVGRQSHRCRGSSVCRSRSRAHCSTPRSTAASTMPSSASIPISGSKCRSRCQASTARSSIRVRHGATRTPMTRPPQKLVQQFVDNFVGARCGPRRGARGGITFPETD
jgi:hypothetical protein